MQFQQTFKKTRIAPTPSGYLHLGNILSFIITTTIAQKTGASVLLRIDDLDQERYQDDYVTDIFEVLDFLEIPWNEGPRNLQAFKQSWSQMHRLPLYEEMLQHLQHEQKLFACNCSRSQLQQTAPEGIYPGTCMPQQLQLTAAHSNWRMITNPEETFTVKTISQQSITAPLPPQMQYFVVRKKDALPAYQLASVADDLHFGVDLIIRGEDLWSSSLAQLCLANHLPDNSFQHAAFHHHPLLKNNEGAKLSKTAGSVSIQYLRKEGKKKEDIYRLLANLTGLQGELTNREAFADAYFDRMLIQ